MYFVVFILLEKALSHLVFFILFLSWMYVEGRKRGGWEMWYRDYIHVCERIWSREIREEGKVRRWEIVSFELHTQNKNDSVTEIRDAVVGHKIPVNICLLYTYTYTIDFHKERKSIIKWLYHTHIYSKLLYFIFLK